VTKGSALQRVLLMLIVALSTATLSATGAQDVYAFLLVGDGEDGYLYLVEKHLFERSAAKMEYGLENGWKVTSCWTYFAKDHTYEDLDSALEHFVSRADEDDIIIFYYVGHGLEDNMTPRPGARGWNFNYDDLNRALRCRAKETVVILDTCYAGSADYSLSGSTWLLAACKSDEKGGAPVTAALLGYVTGDAAPFTQALVGAMLSGNRGVRQTWQAMRFAGRGTPTLYYPAKYAKSDLVIARITVTFDETHLQRRPESSYSEGAGYEFAVTEDAWYGASTFSQFLLARGYVLKTLSQSPITLESLSTTDVLVILEPAEAYAPAEIQAIQTFVKRGGGLFLACRTGRGQESLLWGGHDIADAFGVSFKRGGEICDLINGVPGGPCALRCRTLPNHAITQGVSAFYIEDGTYIETAIPTLAESYKDSWFDWFGRADWGDNVKQPYEESGPFPVMGEMKYGDGRVVFSGDAVFMMNEAIDKLSAKQLALNIVEWLAYGRVNRAIVPEIDSLVATAATGAQLPIGPSRPLHQDDVTITAVVHSTPDCDSTHFYLILPNAREINLGGGEINSYTVRISDFRHPGVFDSDGVYGFKVVAHKSGFNGGTVIHWFQYFHRNRVKRQQWSRTLGGSCDDLGVSVKQTSDGGYIVVGTTWSYGAGESDIWLIKTDPQGNKLWDRCFGGSDLDGATSVQQTADGGYIVSGTTWSYGAGLGAIWLIKTDPRGNKLWDRVFDAYDISTGGSAQQTSDGGYIVLGGGYSFVPGDIPIEGYVYLIKTDPQGNKTWAWERTFGGEHHSGGMFLGMSAQQVSEGDYVVAGIWVAPSAIDPETWPIICCDGWLIKIGEQGNELWERTFDRTGNDDRVVCVREAFDGGYIMVGTTGLCGGTDRNIWLIKTNAWGNKVWDKTFGGSGNEEGYDVLQTSDSGYIIVGEADPYGAGASDVWLIKTNDQGNAE